MTSTASFDDLVHQLLNVPRPKDGSDGNLKAIVSQLIGSCNDSDDKWKRVLLSLLYKRYHMLAPEAKIHSVATNQGDTTTPESLTADTAGDGERLIFYQSIQTLLEQATDGSDSSATTSDRKNLSKAILVLSQLSPHVGGSRDVCKLMEMAAGHILTQEEQATGFLAKESSESMKIAKAVALIQNRLDASAEGSGPYAGLAWLLDFAAKQLGQDLALIQDKSASDADGGTNKKLPSTMHVFVPHNKRGGKNKKGKETSFRKIVNASVEILLWSCSDAAVKNGAFYKSLKTFTDAKIVAAGDKNPIKKALMTMQAVIRSLRCHLNENAREQGFMLTDLYVQDPNKIQIKHIRKAKSSDLSKLTALAKKKNSTTVLRMVQAHFAADPSKITKYDSITEIVSAFGGSRGGVGPGAGEIEKLERSIQVTRLGATIKHLRKVRNAAKDDTQDRVIASVDRASTGAGNMNHVAAVLVAAAMEEWPLELASDVDTSDSREEKKETEADEGRFKLILGKEEQHLSSFQNVVDTETFIGGAGTNESVATTKTLLNLIDRHVTDSESDQPAANLILFTSAGIRIPQDTQSSFSNAGYRVHCHDSDGMGERLDREKARKGDVTISLAWDTYDDLDLHVVIPSGEEIYYGNRNSKNRNSNLDVDMNAGSMSSKEPVENIFLGDADKKIEADHGTYKVIVQNYSYKGSEHKAVIPWRVVIDKNGVKEKFIGSCMGEGKTSNETACEFTYTGRNVAWPGEEQDSFATANLVSLTTSTGQTLESVCKLLGVMKELETLNEVRVLAELDSDSSEDGDDSDEDDRFRGDSFCPDSSLEDGDDESAGVAKAPVRPIQAKTGTLEITSRDRLNMQLAKLPQRFHMAVSNAFGGVSLVDECAEQLSRKMLADKIPLKALAEAGYPKEVINAVSSKLGSAAAGARN